MIAYALLGLTAGPFISAALLGLHHHTRKATR